MTRQFVLCLILIIPILGQAQISNDSAWNIFNKHGINQIENMKYENPDSAIILYEAGYKYFLKQSDTLLAIEYLLDLSNLYANHAAYGKAYDGYWQALFLADNIKSQISKAAVYNGLGWLYSLYDRSEKAISYFNLSLEMHKTLFASKKIDRQYLVDDYYALVTLYRKNNNGKMCRLYIDSCRLYNNGESVGNGAFLKAEIGYLLYNEGDFQEALNILNEILPYFEDYQRSYLAIICKFLGDVNKKLSAYDESEKHYLKALEAIDRYKSHSDIAPDLYHNLADLYALKGVYYLAHQYLTKSKSIEEIQFGSKSENNLVLLEIKDEYRLEKEKQKALIREKRLAQLEHEDRVWYLKSIILIGAIFFLILLGFLLYRHLRARYRAEKRLMKNQQDLEMKKAKEVLEIKNKELTASALQAIEREELLSELKQRLSKQKDAPNPEEIGRLVKNIDLNKSKNWSEFETRFVAVNKSFYQRLTQKFPKLTQNDQRICALAKLNFSSKDMSRLLGISVESVHTVRYRLRKKIGLNRNESLTDFVAKI